MEIRDRAIELIKKGKVKKTRDSEHQVSFNVGSYNPSFKHRPGRTITTCPCQNYGKFPNEGLCKHRFAAIIEWGNEDAIVLRDMIEITEEESEVFDEEDFAILTINNKSRYFKKIGAEPTFCFCGHRLMDELDVCSECR